MKIEMKEIQPASLKGWKPDPCNRCANLSRFAGGNACRVDNGLPLLFGRLHGVPDGAGVDCLSFKETSL